MKRTPDFMRKTPAESAGLIPAAAPAPRTNGATPTALSDEELWRQFREGDVAQGIVNEAERKALAVRRELVAKLEAARREQHRLIAEAAGIRRGLTARREEAERAFRLALDAEMRAGLPIGDPGQAQVYAIERELEASADPRIEEFREWAEHEVNACRMTDAPLIAPHWEPGDKGQRVAAGFDQDARVSIAARIGGLMDAGRHARALKALALEPQEVLAKLREIYSAIPALAAGCSADRRWSARAPEFLTASAHP